MQVLIFFIYLLFIFFFGVNFQTILILSALATISIRNPIHSILWLMFSFIMASILLIKLGANFLGLIFLMVYIGAITVLFLYCIMLLNIRILDWSQYLYQYLPLGSFFGIILTCQIFYIYYLDFFSVTHLNQSEILLSFLGADSSLCWLVLTHSNSSLISIGFTLYLNYGIALVVGGLVLLVAMVGAIILTLNRGSISKKQSILQQELRNFKLGIINY